MKIVNDNVYLDHRVVIANLKTCTNSVYKGDKLKKKRITTNVFITHLK